MKAGEALTGAITLGMPARPAAHVAYVKFIGPEEKARLYYAANIRTDQGPQAGTGCASYPMPLAFNKSPGS